MIQLQYQQLDRHKMIYQYDATEIYIAPQMNLINLEDMGTSIEFEDFPHFSLNETHLYMNHLSIFYIIFRHQYRCNLVMVKNYQKKVRRISKIKAQLLNEHSLGKYRYNTV